MGRRSPPSSLTDAGRLRPRRIGVVRTGALGDFLLGVPALRALRRASPGASVTLAGPMPQTRLALDWDVADAVLGAGDPELAPLFDDAAPVDGIPAAFRDLNLAIAWLGRHRTIASQLQRAGAGSVCSATPFSTGPVPTHTVEWLAGSLAPVGVALDPGWDLQPWLTAPAAGAAWAEGWQSSLGHGTYLVLHPGSGSSRKNWDADKWACLARTVVGETGATLVLTGGEADAVALASVLQALQSHGQGAETVVLPEVSLPQLAGVLAGAHLYLGNDSGVTHLAAGLGTPVVAVFGPTNPALWRPRGPLVRTLGGNHFAGLNGTSTIAPDAQWPHVEAVAEASVSLVRLAGLARPGNHSRR